MSSSFIGFRTRPFFAVVDVGRRDSVPVVVDVRARPPKKPLASRYRLVEVPRGVPIDPLEIKDANVALTIEEEEDW